MLDLAQVVDSLSGMCAATRARAVRTEDQIESAVRVLHGTPWPQLKKLIESRADVPWLVAGLDRDPISSVVELPALSPETYTAIGVDGSQIDLDRHAAAQCFLLNVGLVVIHYGTSEAPTLTSMARLYYQDEDVSPPPASEAESADAWALPVDSTIQSRRTLLESETTAGLVFGNRERTAIAMADNPLIVWTERGQSDDAVKALVLEFCKMLSAGKDASVPVVGYISSPGHKDVVGAVRSTLCATGCGHGDKDPCRGLAVLTDASLFRRILPTPGTRSGLFRSRARAAKHYPPEHAVWFFYLNAGEEMARVEVPAWVKNDPDLLDRVHILAYDQAVKGQGYPVVLTEAHNQAIVRGPERQAFFLLVERALAQSDIPIAITRKALAKRVSVL